MKLNPRQWPSFPGNEGAPCYNDDEDAERAKYLRLNIGRPATMNLCLYNLKTMKTEFDLLVLLEELPSIKCDIVGL